MPNLRRAVVNALIVFGVWNIIFGTNIHWLGHYNLHSCTIIGMVIDGVSKVKIRKYKLMALISDHRRSDRTLFKTERYVL